MDNNKIEKLFGKDLVDTFARINSYSFNYTDEAQAEYGVDAKTNIGVMAQELETNPVTENTVITDDNGTKHLVTEKLAAVDTAVLAEVCKRLVAIEARLDALEG